MNDSYIISKMNEYMFQLTVILTSICTGEQVAGFKDLQTGKIEEIMLIGSPADLEHFKTMYGITGEISKEY